MSVVHGSLLELVRKNLTMKWHIDFLIWSFVDIIRIFMGKSEVFGWLYGKDVDIITKEKGKVRVISGTRETWWLRTV